MDVHFKYEDQSFIWDGRKAAENRGKHGIAFEEACEAFFDEWSIYVDATASDESRAAVIGMSKREELLIVVHIAREENDEIRIISARQATKRERKIYEDS